MTRAELLTACEDAFDHATTSKATKADLTRLLAAIEQSGESREGGPPISSLTFIDPAGQTTRFNLVNGDLFAEAYHRTFPNGVTVEGAGPDLSIDLRSLELFADIAIEFSPPPDQRPILFTFSDPNAEEPSAVSPSDGAHADGSSPEEEETEESQDEAPDEEEPQVETDASDPAQTVEEPVTEEPQVEVDPNEASVT